MKKMCKRFIILTISIALLISLFITVAMPVSAAAANKNNGKGQSGVLSSMPYSRDEDEQKGFWASKIGEATNANLANITLNGIVEINKNYNESDVIESINTAIFTVINMAAAVYGLGGVSETILGGLKEYWEPKGLSERQTMQNEMKEEFKELHEHIDRLEEEMNEMSAQMDESTAKIIAALDDALEADYAKREVMQFFSDSDGNFNYSRFKNYLYGSTNEQINPNGYTQAYYSELRNAITKDPSSPALEMYYQALYRSLMSVSSQNDSNINMFYDAIMYNDSSFKESIQHYYYDYLSANSDKLPYDTTAEYEALKFAKELYLTAEHADKALCDCVLYFGMKIYEENGFDAGDDAIYIYGTGDEDYVTLGQLKQLESAIQVRRENLAKQMAADVAYILNMGNSYLVKDSRGVIREVVNNDSKTYGQVKAGDEIYLNRMVEEYIDRFGFLNEQFTAEFSYRSTKLSGTSDGYYKVGQGVNEFTGCVKYRDRIILKIDFTVDSSDVFSGGSGSLTDPYIISNAEQLLLINNDLKAHYKLSEDLYCNDINLLCIGDEYKPFEGTLDGSGHIIHNLNIVGKNNVGLFGAVGENGIIKNLNFNNCSVKVTDEEKATNRVGIIAGTNSGLIYNCHVTSCQSIIDIEFNGANLNNAINGFAGGIAGVSYGKISYCSVDGDSIISIKQQRNYSGNSDGNNANNAYLGGITGKLFGEISDSYVIDSDIKADIESVVQKKKQKPYIEIKGGGICGTCDSSAMLKNVFAENIEYPEFDYTIDAEDHDGSPKSTNCKADHNLYTCETDLTNYNATSRDKIKFPSFTENYKIEFYYDSESENGKFLEKYNCTQGFAYNYGETKVDEDGLKLKINGTEVEYRHLVFYGLDTSNRDKTAFKPTSVFLVFIATCEGVDRLFTYEMPIVIKENCPVELIVTDAKTSFYYGESISFSKMLYLIKYQDGSFEFVEGSYSLPTDAAAIGTHLVNVSYTDSIYGEFRNEFEIYVSCRNHQYKNEEKMPTCSSFGYTECICQIPGCGYSYVLSGSYKAPTEHLFPEEINDATCKSEGYVSDEVCSVCGYIKAFGHVTEKLPHAFIPAEGTEASLVHYCSKCNEEEGHQFTTIENTDAFVHSCVTCGYTAVESKKPNGNEPRVVVSSGYVLESKQWTKNKDSEVTLYVQIINNPGITGVSFSVVYDNCLSLISCESGEVMDDGLTIINMKDDRNICFISKAQAYSSAVDGNLVKLVFRVPNEVSLGKVFNIHIAKSNSDDTVTDGNNQAVNDIITVPGTITVVDHLPGDVNGDKSTDILDAFMILRNNSAYESDVFQKKHADVNLDGKVGIGDTVELIRYLFGGYDVRLAANKYQIVLNYNDGSSVHGAKWVEFYDENGNRGKYNLPILTRDGYRFDGWYTGIGENATQAVNGTDIIYNASQPRQTLYARYTLNKVTFHGNGGEGEMPSVTYKSSGEWLELNNEFEKNTKISYKVNHDKITSIENCIIYQPFKFSGWATTPDGEVKFKNSEQINMKSGGFGELSLYAVWENVAFTLNVPESWTDLYGYELIYWSSNDEKYNVGDVVSISDSEFIINAKWDLNTFKIIFDVNDDDTLYPGSTANGKMDPSNWNVEMKGASLPYNNTITRNGYTFVGWSLSKNGNGIVDYQDGAKIEKLVNVTADNEMILYAQWKPKSYNITYNYNQQEATSDKIKTFNFGDDYIKEIEIYSNSSYEDFYAPSITRTEYDEFLGWFTDSDFTTPFDENYIEGWRINPSNITLYAKWNYAIYYKGASGQVPRNITAMEEVSFGEKYIRDAVVIDLSDSDTNSFASSSGGNQVSINYGVKNVYLIGNSDRTYNISHIAFKDYPVEAELDVYMDNFKFNGNLHSKYENSWQDAGMLLTINVSGECEINSDDGDGAISYLNNVTITGDGVLTVRGKDGYNPGTHAINVQNLTVSGNVTLNAYGGKGSGGSNGANADGNPEHGGNGGSGASGGYAVLANSVILNGGNINFVGGSGGNGGSGGRGDNSDSIFDSDGDGGDGGSGGSGGIGIKATTIEISDNVTGTISGGCGGNGGRGGNGGSGVLDDSTPGDGGSGGSGGAAISCNVITLEHNVTITNGTKGSRGSDGTD